MCLKLSMSRNASANRPCLVAPQQAVGAMLDHAPRRQTGQFVIIGGTEQLILDRLLLADVGRARQQQIAVGDADRPMGGEKDLLGRAAGDAFFRTTVRPARSNSRQVSRRSLVRARDARPPEQGRGGVVHQQELALLVLNRDAGRQQPEDIPQHAQFGLVGVRRGRSRQSAGRVCRDFACRGLGEVSCSFG